MTAAAALALLAGLALGPHAISIDEKTVPAAFRGEWNERLEDCGTGNNDSRLEIGARDVQFYESGGQVRGAFLNGTYEIIIVLNMSGEGQTWLASHQFTLASDGSHLSSRSADGSLFTRYRCPRT